VTMRLRAASGWTTCGHMRKTFLPLVSKKHCPAGGLFGGRHVKISRGNKPPPRHLKTKKKKKKKKTTCFFYYKKIKTHHKKKNIFFFRFLF
ncbi:hypothetical protein ACVGX7_12480, partial [Enterobacter hormaechei]